jgi:hypothetical protein
VACDLLLEKEIEEEEEE